MSKTMCERDKKEREKAGEDARYYCKKCKEEAKKEKHLCKPEKL